MQTPGLRVVMDDRKGGIIVVDDNATDDKENKLIVELVRKFRHEKNPGNRIIVLPDLPVQAVGQ